MSNALFEMSEIPIYLQVGADFDSLKTFVEKWELEDDDLDAEVEAIMLEEGLPLVHQRVTLANRFQELQEKSVEIYRKIGQDDDISYPKLVQFNVCLLGEPNVSDETLVCAIIFLRSSGLDKEKYEGLRDFAGAAALRLAKSRKSARSSNLMYNIMRRGSDSDDLRWKQAVGWLEYGFQNDASQDRFACRFEYLVLTYFKLTGEKWSAEHEQELKELSKMKISGYADGVPSYAEDFLELKNRQEWWEGTYQYRRM